MGQLDSVNQLADAGIKLNFGGIQFHEVHGAQPAASPTASDVGFHSVPLTPAADNTTVATVAAPAQLAPINYQDTRPAVVAQASAPPRPTSDYGQANAPRPPHPDDTDSVSDKVGLLATNAATLGASYFVAKHLRDGVRATEAAKWGNLAAVTQPATLAQLRTDTEATTKLVASKSREANAAVEAIADAKPQAFDEISEPMPVKSVSLGQQQAPPQLVFKEVRDQTLLTEDEIAVTDRANYLRSMERVLVKDFNIENTSTVSAFEMRKPYIEGLGKSEAAVAEGIAQPLNNVESLSNKLMAETTSGRLNLHNAGTSEIYKGIGVLAGSYVATRGIDYFAYGGKSQGFLTTAYDCAAPLIAFTSMSPLAKFGVMVAGHEAVRLVETMIAKNKDQ
jgi:hypothetical protein